MQAKIYIEGGNFNSACKVARLLAWGIDDSIRLVRIMYPPVIKVINGIYPWNIIKSVGLRLGAEKQIFTLDMLLTFPAIHSVIFLTPKRCLMRRCNAKCIWSFVLANRAIKYMAKVLNFQMLWHLLAIAMFILTFPGLTMSVKNSKSAENILLINQANLASW